MPIVPLTCPSCGANLKVDSSKDAAICEYCGKPYIVQDAIVRNYIRNVTNINAQDVNVYTQKDFEITAGVLKKYTGESVNVRIPNNVKSIAGAFKLLPIETVNVPEGAVSIDYESFAFCSKLTDIRLPNSLRIIGDYAFHGCSALQRIVLPEGLVKIGRGAFFECRNLKEIVIPRSVNSIDDDAFSVTGLNTITIPGTVHYLGANVFAGCPSIKKAVVEEGIQCISKGMFRSCHSLSTIRLPNSLIAIDASSFEDCIMLDDPQLPNSLKNAFMYNTNEIRRVFDNTPFSWKKLGRCSHCGGTFTGGFMLLTDKRCSKCGRTKDY